eukprot:gene39479-48784_t
MLHTMYDPSVAINDLETHDTVQLFTIADKYEIQPLKALCCANLTSNTCAENAVIMLKLGDVYDETGDLGETLCNELIHYLVSVTQEMAI